jgi:hypothetical protein
VTENRNPTRPINGYRGFLCVFTTGYLIRGGDVVRPSVCSSISLFVHQITTGIPTQSRYLSMLLNLGGNS